MHYRTQDNQGLYWSFIGVSYVNSACFVTAPSTPNGLVLGKQRRKLFVRTKAGRRRFLGVQDCAILPRGSLPSSAPSSSTFSPHQLPGPGG